MAAGIYRVRRSMLEQEREWRIDEQGLSWAPPAGRTNWSDFTEIRLIFAPTRFDTSRYLCRIASRKGPGAIISSAHFIGPANFEDRAESYAPFIRSLIAEASRRNQQVTLIAGETRLRYIANAALLVGSLGALLLLLLLFGVDALAPMGIGMEVVVGLKALVILVAIPAAVLWLRRNRAVPFTADAIPVDMLPASSSDQQIVERQGRHMQALEEDRA